VSQKVIEANPPHVSVTIADFGYHVSCSQKLWIVWISNMLTLSYEGYSRIESWTLKQIYLLLHYTNWTISKTGG
jgi:hypothetical protein